VFSPYYALARRRGTADPENHAALNVAIYGEGGGWAMTERGRGALSRSEHRLQVGPSRMDLDGDTLTVAFDEITVPLPRRLTGVIRVRMPRVETEAYALDDSADHIWRPIAPVARIEVDLERPACRWSGHAYVDHNRGRHPLESGFRRWSWARTTGEAGTTVTYSVEPRAGAPRAFAVAFGQAGGVTVQPAPPAVTLRRTGWLLPRSICSEEPAVTKVVRTLEDTPFYARSIVTARVFGRTATGIHESLSLDRFRSPVVQLMLPFRMPRRAG
jgi:carotenoid 1,2-hydratase